MDDIGRYIWGTVVIILLILIAMFFAAVGTAVASLSGSQLKRLSEEEGDEKAGALFRIKQNQFGFSLFTGAATLLSIGTVLALGIFLYAAPVQLLFSGLSQRAAELIVLIILLFLLTIICYLLPKKLVSYRAESFGYFALSPLKILGPVFYVITWPVMQLTRLIVRICGFDPNAEAENISEEEIRLLVDAGNEKGTIETSEREMINNVFEFDDRTVDEVMTHRTEICAVSKDDTVEEVLHTAIEEGFSRIPVYDNGIDDIVGVIYAKDLLVLAGCTDLEERPLTSYIHEVIYVPESTRCRMLFRQFKATKRHMAVVVDEYGGTAGIATMEDLLESIVGQIQDEYDSEEEEISRLKDGSYSFDGSVSIDKVEEILHADLDADDDDADTLGGLIINLLGRIPEDEERPSITVDGILFTVTRIEERRVARITAQRLPEQEKDNNAETEKDI